MRSGRGFDVLPPHLHRPEGKGILQGRLAREGILQHPGPGHCGQGTTAGGRSSLWVRALNTSSARQFPETDGASFPFWSPDNKFIGFFVTGKLKKISVSGGPPIVICDAPNGRGGTWNQDGVILFSPSFDLVSIHRVSASGGVPTPVTHLDSTRNESNHRWPHFLPDGKHFIYTTQGSVRSPEYAGAMYVASLDSSVNKLLMKVSSNMAYYNGYLLYVRQRSVVAQPFDLSKLELSGDASPIAEKIEYSGDKSRGIFSISANGVLTYQASGNNTRLLSIVDGNGKKLSDVGERPMATSGRLSRDGTKVAFDSNDLESAVADIWIYDLTRKINTRFTFDQSGEWQPVWSPDGQRIVYASDKSGSGDLFLKSANGTEAEQVVLKDIPPKQVDDWSPDGRLILYQSFVAGTYWDLWIIPADGDRKPSVFLQTKFEEVNARFSPDGRWVAYQSDESGAQEIYVRPFPAGEGKWQISSNGGESPLWSRDGKELFYMDGEGNLTGVPMRVDGQTPGIGTPVKLFHAPILGGDQIMDQQQYAVSRDGQRFLINTIANESNAFPITIVTDWTRLLKK